ncbi:hypothetical protein EYF80_046880 [Liparis tanakae]|uniref:Uncharacterized protein n=1 Tax=Liparis tanakae TaxID=230148 RepID=A0A4Z2FRC5_9TELE|nr:hypothetical protein EYF80_046880 [Liparis tanakae]
MSKAQMLRGLVNQRLTAAAQEICGLFEGTISEYEEELYSLKEENERHRRLLDAVFNPEVRLQRADVQQLLVVKEEVPSEQQVWISSLDQVHPEPLLVKEEQEDQENPEHPHIKEKQEEQEELWTSREGEQLQGLEEAGLKFSFTTVKSEADEEEARSSQVHQRQTEQMEIEANGDDCGGPEPARNADPDRPPDPDEKTGDSSEPDTDEDSSEPETDDSIFCSPASGFVCFTGTSLMGGLRGLWMYLVQTGDPDLVLRKNLFFNHQQLLDVCGKYPEDSSTASWTCCFTNSVSFSPGDTETDTGGSSDSIFERRMRSWMLCMMGKRFAVVTES